jgi:hypothetical protein
LSRARRADLIAAALLPASLLGLSGLCLLIAALTQEAPSARPKLWSIIFVEVGIALLITAIAESSVLGRMLGHLRDEVKLLLAKVRDDYDIVEHSNQNGSLTSLRPPN